MKKFKHLDVPRQWTETFTKYPHGLTIFEALCDWTTQVDSMVDNINSINDYMTGFIDRFDGELKSEIANSLNKMYEDGVLEQIINDDVFSMKANTSDLLEVSSDVEKNKVHSFGWLNVRSYGAKGDGETDDYIAIQNAINDAYTTGISKVYIPAGYYYVSQTLRTRNDGVWDRVGIEILGSGLNTKLSRMKKSDTFESSTMMASLYDDELANEPVLAIHSVKNIVSNLTLTKSRVGLYIGQDPREPNTPSNCHYNRFSNLFIQHVGTGICFRSGYGDYYNFFYAIQVASGNIGIDMSKGYKDSVGVSNRNYFDSCEIDKVQAGVILLNGDTNTFNAVHFEGIGHGGSYGTVPDIIPDGIATGIYVTYQLNTFQNCICENVIRDVYDDAYGTNYINNSFDLYNNKFKRGSKSRIGTFIGFGRGGSSNGFINGGLFYQGENIVTGKGPLDESRPVNRISVTAREIGDDGYLFKYQDLDTISDSIDRFRVSSSRSRFKSLGCIRHWWVKGEFQLNLDHNLTSPILLKMPIEPTSNLIDHGFRVGMKFPVIVGSEILVGTLKKIDEISYLSIPAPNGGWIRGENLWNTIDFHISYY